MWQGLYTNNAYKSITKSGEKKDGEERSFTRIHL